MKGNHILFIIMLFMLALAGCAENTATDEAVLPSPEPEDVLEDEPVQSDILSYVTLLDAQAMGIYIEDGDENLSLGSANKLLDSFYYLFDSIGIEYTRSAGFSSNDELAKSGFLEMVYSILELAGLPEEYKPYGDADSFLAEAGITYDITYVSDPYTISTDDAALTLSRAAVYAADACGAGSKGLLWAVSDSGATVYLLGSVHVDDDMIYPFDSQLIDIILSSDILILEIDFGDTEGIMYYYNNVIYTEGDLLSNHISNELMAEILDIYSDFGVTDRSIIESYRPWVLASEIQSLSMYYREDDNKTPIVIDMYVYYKALENGIEIKDIEGYEYQVDLFNGLDDETMEAYLQSAVDIYNGYEPDGEDSMDELTQMIKAWRECDLDAFSEIYDKDSQEDPLSLALFLERDENMTEYILSLLQEGEGQYLVTVGAGHMVGADGIVARLEEAGYSAELVYTD